MDKQERWDRAAVQDDLVALGLRVAAARRRSSLTQAQLATLVEMNSVTISRIETAKQSISVASLIHIARALNTTAADLMSDEAPN